MVCTHSLLTVHLSALTLIWPGFPGAGVWQSLKINCEIKKTLNCEFKTTISNFRNFSSFFFFLAAILELSVISHGLHQQMKFTWLSSKGRYLNFDFFLSTFEAFYVFIQYSVETKHSQLDLNWWKVVVVVFDVLMPLSQSEDISEDTNWFASFRSANVWTLLWFC